MRQRLFIVIALVSCFNAALTLHPQLLAQQGLFEALYIYKFCSFVTFPPDRQTGDFVIGVLNAPDIAAQLERTVNGKMLGLQAIRVRSVSDTGDLGGCHIVFVPDNMSKKLPKVQELAHSKAMLIVSKGAGMAREGAHINIMTNGDKKFEINRTAAETVGLKLSADLLKLAVIL
jgi:YfiR/HmsC-like